MWGSYDLYNSSCRENINKTENRANDDAVVSIYSRVGKVARKRSDDWPPPSPQSLQRHFYSAASATVEYNTRM